MKLKLTCLALGIATSACAAGVSAAATAPVAPALPRVVVGHPTDVTTTSATLTATLSPDGADTLYYFAYGPTLTGGTTSAEKSVPYTLQSATVAYDARGLQPGTTYFYGVHALSSEGEVITKVVSFTTRGKAPAAPLTGAAVALSSGSAELTGVVNPSAAATSYDFTIANAAGTVVKTTAARTVARGAKPVRVSAKVTGLAPYTTYTATLTSTSGSNPALSGDKQSFETFPTRTPIPTVTAHTTPRIDRTAPYAFSTSGTVKHTAATPDFLACQGAATISVYSGQHRISHLLAPLTSTCTYSATATFASLPIPGTSGEKLRVYVRFSGNPYLRGVLLKPTFVTIG